MSEQTGMTQPAGRSVSGGGAGRLLEQGAVPTADDLVSPVLPRDPMDGPSWFAAARHLAAAGQYSDALDCCRRAVEMWPDVLPVLQLSLDLADRLGGEQRLLDVTRRMVPMLPDDVRLKNRLAGMLCARGEHLEALPLLRMTAPVLKHADDALWNYTSSLALTDNFAELLTLEPLLDELAATVPPPYGPYVHLAVAKLAQAFDIPAAVRESNAISTSSLWLDGPLLIDRLTDAIRIAAPFSMIRISAADVRLFLYVEPYNLARLKPQELSAVVNSVWQAWFTERIESHGSALADEVGASLLHSIDTADVIILPMHGLVGRSSEQGSFGAPVQRLLLERPAAKRSRHPFFTDDAVLAVLHETMPFLRPLLSGLPFLGFVGWHTGMADKLAHFCSVGELVKYALPADQNLVELPPELRSGQHFPDGYRRVLSTLIVPRQGDVFLVAAGVLGKLYCSHIKRLGGIAIDVGALAGRWAGY